MAMLNIISTLGIIGDIHCEDENLKIALEFLKPKQLDAVVCVGDIVDGPGDLHETLNLLSKHNVQAIAGNHERWLLANEMRELKNALNLDSINSNDLKYIQKLPKRLELSCSGGQLLVCHGLLDDDENVIKPDDYGYALEVNDKLHELLKMKKYKYVVNGHTHERMVRTFGDCTIINAGTLYREHDPCFGIIDFVSKEVQFFNIINYRAVSAEKMLLP